MKLPREYKGYQDEGNTTALLLCSEDVMSETSAPLLLPRCEDTARHFPTMREAVWILTWSWEPQPPREALKTRRLSVLSRKSLGEGLTVAQYSVGSTFGGSGFWVVLAAFLPKRAKL